MTQDYKAALPLFRHVIKAIGNHEDAKNTAYRYEIVEFQPSGRFIIRPAVFITETQMRADGDRLYEMQEAGSYVLASAQEFQAFKTAWDELRVGLGYSAVDAAGVES